MHIWRFHVRKPQLYNNRTIQRGLLWTIGELLALADVRPMLFRQCVLGLIFVRKSLIFTLICRHRRLASDESAGGSFPLEAEHKVWSRGVCGP